MISIIVPHYCTKKEYFDRCMQSLLDDHDADIEVIVVDDGSPDLYLSNIAAFLGDGRVRVFYEEHKGVSNARNIGIREALGEWLMFVDSDDYLDKDYANILSELSQCSDTDVIIFNGFGDRFGRIIPNKYFVEENTNYGESIEKKRNLIGSCLSLGRTPEFFRCYYTLGSPCSKLIRTSFLKRKGIEFDKEVKFAEDTIFSMNLFYYADRIYYHDLYLYHYCMNEDSVTGKYRRGLSVDMDLFFSKALAFLRNTDFFDSLRESYYIRAFLECQRCVRNEFYHRKNEDKNKATKTKAFLNKEPYRTSLVYKSAYMRRYDCRISSYLLRKGLFIMYMMMYNILSRLRKLFTV